MPASFSEGGAQERCERGGSWAGAGVSCGDGGVVEFGGGALCAGDGGDECLVGVVGVDGVAVHGPDEEGGARGAVGGFGRF